MRWIARTSMITESVPAGPEGVACCSLPGQGQRPLNRCSSKDFQQVVFVPTTTATFHDETRAVGMLLQE